MLRLLLMIAFACASLGAPLPKGVDESNLFSQLVSSAAGCDGSELSPEHDGTELTLIQDVLDLSQLSACVDPASQDIELAGKATVTASQLPVAPPDFGVSGEVSATGASTLTMSVGSDEEPWVPLPDLLPDFKMPALEGELTLDGDGGVSFELTAEPTGSFKMADGMLEFKDWGGSLAVTAPNTTVDVTAAGTMRIGGEEGFEADVSAAFSFEDDVTATVEIEHGGGWSPIKSGSLSEVFKTPAFSGTLVVGGEVRFSLEASAEWAGPLVLLPDVIEVQAIGDSQAGPSLDVTLEQADEEDAEAEWAVNFAGAVAIVALSDSDLPALGVEGALRSTGASTLTMSVGSDEEPWVPLPDLLPDFKMPALEGELTLDGEGGVSFELTATAVGTFSIGDVVTFEDWAGSLAVTAPDKNVAVGASGTMRIGGTDGFVMTTEATIESDGPKLSVAARHPGGFAPFKNLLPGFTTPECEAELRLDGAADSEERLYFMARAELGDSIELGDPTIVTFKGKKDAGARASGPEFGLTVVQETKDDGLAVDVFFDSEVCVELGDNVCLDVHASLGCDGGSKTPGDDAGCNFELAGAYKGGDIYPLAAVGDVLPQAVRDAFKILANEETPIELALTAETSPPSLGFDLKGGFEIDLNAMELGTLSGSLAAGGTLGDGGVDGYFVGALDFPPTFGKTKDGGDPLGNATSSTWYVSVATRDGFIAELNGEEDEVGKGLTLGWRGPSLIPELCDGGMGVAIALKDPTTMDLSAECEFDNIEMPTAEARANGATLAPSINFVAFRSLGIGAELSPGEVEFRIGAGFQIATSSSVRDSDCADPNNDGACLTIDTEIAIGISSGYVPPEIVNGPSVTLTFDFQMHGTWLEPLGLPNFAIGNPAFALGIQIYAPGVYMTPPTWQGLPHCFAPTTGPPVPLPCTHLRELAFNIDLYWKRSGTWPESLLTKKKKNGVMVAPFPDACDQLETRECFTPDNSDPDRIGDLVILKTSFLYEKAPHDDTALSLLGLPRFGVKFELTDMSLLDIVNIAADLAGGVAALATPPATAPNEFQVTVGGGDWQSEVSWDLTCSGESIGSGGAPYSGTLSAPPGECTLDMYDSYGDGWNGNLWEGAGYTFTLDSGSSNSATFTVSTSAPTRPELPDDITDFLEGVSFGLAFEISLVNEGEFSRRLYLFATSRADFGGLGNFFFMIETELQLPSPAEIPSFVADPLANLRAGFKANATINLPFACAVLDVDISPTNLESALQLNLGVLGDYRFTGSITNAGVRVTYTAYNPGAAITGAIKGAIEDITGDLDSASKERINAAFPELESIAFTLDTITDGERGMGAEIGVKVGDHTETFRIFLPLDFNSGRRSLEAPALSRGHNTPANKTSNAVGRKLTAVQNEGPEEPDPNWCTVEPLTADAVIDLVKKALDLNTILGWVGVEICPSGSDSECGTDKPICIAGMCQECGPIDSSNGCDTDEFCLGGAEYKCTEKWNTGRVGCLNDNVCKSNVCNAATVCVECADSNDCDDDEYCTTGAQCKSCSSGIRSGEAWSWTETGACVWGCCNSEGLDAGWDTRCSTGITNGDHWSYQQTGACVWGCCHSDGTDRGYSQRCSTGITHGDRWSYQETGRCVWGCCHNDGTDRGYSSCSTWSNPFCLECNGIGTGGTWSKTVSGACFWGCCNNDGTDAGWDNYCSTGITSGDAWSKTVNGDCFWGCCNNDGTDAGWDNYCGGNKLSHGEQWSKTHSGTCVWGCCNSDGTDAIDVFG